MGLKKRKAVKEDNTKQTLQSYLNEISMIPLLTIEEEKALGYRARSGDEEAVQKLVESNLRFVVKVAKKYRRYGVPFLDLINEGNLGLIEAARRFDPNRNVRFISYAIWWIRQSILTVLSDMSHPLRLPLKVNNMLYKVGLTASRFANDLNDKPSLQDIAGGVGLSIQELTEILKVGGEALSLDQPMRESNRVLENLLPQTNTFTAEDGLMRDALKKDLRNALKQLRENEQEVLNLRFGLNQEKCFTLKQIGERIGVSRERVRQIQEKALEKLRQSNKARSLYAGSLAGVA
jgi:RNA polymerase sigma factor, sigma-70 family